MEVTNDLLLRVYAQRIENLDDPDGLGTDELLAALSREEVASREWSGREQSEIARIDDLLLSHWQQFEGVLPNPNFQDRTHWWWFLNEGPQVREEALRYQAEAEKISL